jgi:acetylcholinesterase
LTSQYPDDPAQGSPFDTGAENQLGPQYKRLAALIGDYTFQAPRRDLLHHTAGRQNAWSYQIADTVRILGRVPLLNKDQLAQISVTGAFHISDVVLYAFATIPAAISKNTLNIMSTFISFANSLDPNNHGLKSLPVWPKYDNAKPQLFQFREDQCAIIADDCR